MVWCQTEHGKSIPLDSDDGVNAAERENANLVIIGEADTERGKAPLVRYVKAGTGKFTTHFATCEFASQHRRR